MMECMEVGGMTFPIIGHVERKSGDLVPMLGIAMMSDERWQQDAADRAVKFFRKQNGREPESVQDALKWQRAFIEKLEREELCRKRGGASE